MCARVRQADRIRRSVIRKDQLLCGCFNNIILVSTINVHHSIQIHHPLVYFLNIHVKYSWFVIVGFLLTHGERNCFDGSKKYTQVHASNLRIHTYINDDANKFINVCVNVYAEYTMTCVFLLRCVVLMMVAYQPTQHANIHFSTRSLIREKYCRCYKAP